MHRYGCVCLALAVSATIACGKKSEDQRQESAVEQAQKGAETVAESAEDMAKGLESLAKGLGALTGGGDGKVVEPVSFRDLQAVFPDLGGGWEKGKPTGEKMTSPVPFSQAEVTYRKGESSIEAKAIDSGFNQILMAPFAMFLTAGYEKETDSGYEKSVKVAGYPGWERWNGEGKDGELNAVVNKRFLLTFEGSNIDDTRILHELAQKADLGKLSSIK